MNNYTNIRNERTHTERQLICKESIKNLCLEILPTKRKQKKQKQNLKRKQKVLNKTLQNKRRNVKT